MKPPSALRGYIHLIGKMASKQHIGKTIQKENPAKLQPATTMNSLCISMLNITFPKIFNNF